MTAERAALRALHDAAQVTDPQEHRRADERALAGELMRRKGQTLESLREQGLTLARTGIDTDVVIRLAATPYALAAIRLAADHPDFTDLPAYEQARLAVQYLPPADLETQVRDAQEQLNALARRIRELSGLADEQDRPDVVDGRSDVRPALNDAAQALGRVIV